MTEIREYLKNTSTKLVGHYKHFITLQEYNKEIGEDDGVDYDLLYY